LEWGDDDDGVEIEVEPDGSLSVLIDAQGGVDERHLTGPDDPGLLEALLWAAKLA
jgi:hypothetical protein